MSTAAGAELLGSAPSPVWNAGSSSLRMNQDINSTASASHDGAAPTRILRSGRRARPSSLCLSCFPDIRSINGLANATESLGNAVLARFRASARDKRCVSLSVRHPSIRSQTATTAFSTVIGSIEVGHEAAVGHSRDKAVVWPSTPLDLAEHLITYLDQPGRSRRRPSVATPPSCLVCRYDPNLKVVGSPRSRRQAISTYPSQANACFDSPIPKAWHPAVDRDNSCLFANARAANRPSRAQCVHSPIPYSDI